MKTLQIHLPEEVASRMEHAAREKGVSGQPHQTFGGEELYGTQVYRVPLGEPAARAERLARSLWSDGLLARRMPG